MFLTNNKKISLLLDSLIEYSNGAFDIHSRITATPDESLTNEDKVFILNNFFDANYQNMILANDEYHRLYKIVQMEGTENTDIFTLQEYSDLMALFNLAWIDPSFKASDRRLKRLVKKGRDYTYEDRLEILEVQREIISKIIPTLKKLLKKTQVLFELMNSR